MKDLKGKRILFIAPKFFNYDIEVKNHLEIRGAFVSLYDDRPTNNAIIKGIIRINRNLLKSFINRYYNRIINENKSVDYDFVFFMKGESITVNALESLKHRYSKAKFILYLWDSIGNNNNNKIFKYFDRVLSFDKEDCLTHKNFVFRPLFFLDYFKEIGNYQNLQLTYDFSFIGTAHSDRYNIIEFILKSVKNKNKVKIVLFMPSKLLFWFRKVIDNNFRKVPISGISFESVPFQKVMECFILSKAIIDIQHPNQTGLTMRTFETLGAKKKLITTNLNIKEYDFFYPNNILIIDREYPIIPDSFLFSNYTELPKSIYDKYSIEGWVDDCFNLV